MNSLNDPLDSILAAPSKVRLIRILLTLDKPVSGREAARLAEVSQRPALRSLTDLVSLGVVERKRTAMQHLFQINRDHYLIKNGLNPLFEAEKSLKRGILGSLKRALSESNPGEKAPTILSISLCDLLNDEDSGSHNEINILVVAGNEEDQTTVWRRLVPLEKEVEQRYGIRLSALVLTTAKFQALFHAQDAVVQKAVADSMHVYGFTAKEMLEKEATVVQKPTAHKAEQPEVQVVRMVEDELTAEGGSSWWKRLARSRTR